MQLLLALLLSSASAPMNCVNPGGGCNGTVPCCGDAYCVRNRCMEVPQNPPADQQRYLSAADPVPSACRQ